MSQTVYIAVTVLVALLAAAVGWALAQIRAHRRISTLRESNVELKTALDLEKRNTEDKTAALEHARSQLAETFNNLSNQALKHNTEEFLKLARENLQQFQVKAENDLASRQKHIEQIIKPIQETLQKTETELRQMEKERKESYGALHEHLKSLARAQETLQGETRNLVQALRRPEVRGQWGEMTLRRVVELAGMVEHCDFYEQASVTGESGVLRPDMVVRMPDGRQIVVDVKTPLDAYLTAAEATDDTAREQALERHARKLSERVRELSTKAYWSQFDNTPDFVVLFIPGEQFLSAALEKDRSLLEEALKQKIILATPTTLVALLRAVAYGWRQEALAENADRIRELGEELYRRLATFTDHMIKVGKSLGSTVENYNKAVGSLERQVLPGARRMDELGIHARKTLERPEPLEKSVRNLEKE